MKSVALPPVNPLMSRDKANTLLLLFACTLVLASHVIHLATWVSAACGLLLLWRGWITWFGNRLPSRKLLLPLAIVAMAGVYQTYHTLLGRETGVTMLTLLLSLKLLEMHAKRDLYVVVYLSFFLMLTTFFYAQTMETALIMVVAVIALLTAQLSFQYIGIVPPLKQRLRLTLSIVGLAAPVMLVLFFLFPRVQGPLWGLPNDGKTAGTGLSESMSPGKISSLALSDDIAFRVKFLDPPPPQSKLYWRGVVLGKYDGRTWTQLHTNAATDYPLALRARGRQIRHQVTLEPNGRRWIFALEFPQAAPALFNNTTGFAPDLQLLTEQPIQARVRYDVQSYVDFDLEARTPSIVLQDWLQLPEGFNPRTLEWAIHLGNLYSNPVQIVNAVLKFFHDENFVYTLKPPLLGEHAVDDFLFTTRAGFCEHYASAFVVILRALGIPARVVTGYQGGDIDPIDGFMRVRQSDAHAWAEVWLENRGWMRFDPTTAVAPDRIEHSVASGNVRALAGDRKGMNSLKNSWLANLRAKWDPVTNAWNQWILNYTPDRQKNFLRALGFDQPDWRALAALMLTAATLVIAIIAYSLLKNRQKIEPVKALYLVLCQEMAKQGLARAMHEGPHDYAKRLTAPDSPLAPDKKIKVARFLKFYEAVQYGPHQRRSAAVILSQLKSLLAQCR